MYTRVVSVRDHLEYKQNEQFYVLKARNIEYKLNFCTDILNVFISSDFLERAIHIIFQRQSLYAANLGTFLLSGDF